MGGGREGTHVYLQLSHVVRQRLTQHCKAVILQFLKRKSKSLSNIYLGSFHVELISPLPPQGALVLQVLQMREQFN